MQERARIGALFLAGESWWEAGVCGATEGPYAGFVEKLESDVRAITSELEKHYTVVTSGLIHSTDSAIREARRFNAEAVEAIIFCPVSWTNDPPVVAFLQEANKVPMVIWAYNPYPEPPDFWTLPVWLRAGGPVSVQQSSNILSRLGWQYNVVFGNEREAAVLKELDGHVRAAVVYRGLRGTRIAVLPAPCRVVVSTWVDDFFLLERFGVELEYVSVDQFARIAAGIDDKRVRHYTDYLKGHYPVIDVPDEMLTGSARQALALLELARQRALSGIALEDFNDDIYRTLGYRPHLYHPDIGEIGCTIGFEADVLNVLSTIVVGRLSGQIGMFNEFFTVDPGKNTVLMGHPGHGEIRFADESTVMVTPDLEFDATQKRGAWLSYRARPGQMTFLNFTPEYGKLKCAAFQAEALGGPRIMEGYSHMLVQPRVKVRELFRGIVEDGLIQHWGTAYGEIMPEVRAFARLAGLELNVYE
jgi:L-arabinose isomerase